MRRTGLTIVWALVMIAVIVSVDVLFLRHHFWPRLAVNVGIVAVFVGLYFAVRGRRD